MRNFFYRLKQFFNQFMQGRYGTDKLNLVILGTAFFLEIIYYITKWPIFTLLSLGLIILNLVRSFSRNIPKRYAENQKFEKLWSRLKMRKTHHIYSCPSCKQKIRVPRLHGKRVEIRCPKCGQTFVKKV